MSASERREAYAAATLLAVLVVVRALDAIHGFDVQVALRGFSPIGWIHRLAAPEQFTADWPDGTDAYAASLLMQAYRLAHAWLHIEPEDLLPVMITVEVAVTAVAHWLFARALLPTSRPLVPAVFAALALVSNASATSLANFASPYFWGQFYNFANAFRLLAIAAALRSRWVSAGALIGVCAMTHLIYGVTGGAAVFAIRLWSRARPSRDDALAIALAAGLAGAWTIGVVARPGVGSGGVPVDVWYAWTRFFNVHFYPIGGGMLGERHTERLLPFLTLIGVAIAQAFRDRGPEAAERRDRALAAVAVLTALTAVGLMISVYPPSPVLVKLCLHRASDLAGLIALGWVVAGAIEDWDRGGYFAAFLALVFLLAPFLTAYEPAFPLLVGALWVATTARAIAPRARAAAGSALALGVVVVVVATLRSGPFRLSATAYTLYDAIVALKARATRVPLAAALALPLIRRWDPRVATAGLVLALGLATAWWLHYDRRGADVDTMGPAYLETQLWARANTPPGALFMTDPTIYYGWRDFSRRPSFGNVREWAHTAWLYDSRADVFAAGRERLGALGLAVEPYLAQPGGQSRLTDDARRAFYALDDAGRRRIAERFGIDYFVLDRRHYTGTSTLTVAYQNQGYVVLRGRAP